MDWRTISEACICISSCTIPWIQGYEHQWVWKMWLSNWQQKLLSRRYYGWVSSEIRSWLRARVSLLVSLAMSSLYDHPNVRAWIRIKISSMNTNVPKVHTPDISQNLDQSLLGALASLSQELKYGERTASGTVAELKSFSEFCASPRIIRQDTAMRKCLLGIFSISKVLNQYSAAVLIVRRTAWLARFQYKIYLTMLASLLSRRAGSVEL